jgi:rhodanese-related sulfurtransferase
MAQPDERDRIRGRSGRGVAVAAVVLGAVLAVAFVAAGTPGLGEDSGDGGAGRASTAGTGDDAGARLDPAEFAARITEPSAFVVNVHIPYEGEIDGTDAFIPYDEIVGDHRLPDEHTEILLYCMSGRMSDEAMASLVNAGYTNVVHLEGGMKAWEAAGMPLLMSRGTGAGA